MATIRTQQLNKDRGWKCSILIDGTLISFQSKNIKHSQKEMRLYLVLVSFPIDKQVWDEPHFLSVKTKI